jgi:excinuclease ABC subunit C
LIQQIRNEAHRFGIAHHRRKRIKANLTSSLDNISGIGPKTTTALIAHFGSVKKLMVSDFLEVVKIVGVSKAKKIFNSKKT